jgi:hypothetical protein
VKTSNLTFPFIFVIFLFSFPMPIVRLYYALSCVSCCPVRFSNSFTFVNDTAEGQSVHQSERETSMQSLVRLVFQNMHYGGWRRGRSTDRTTIRRPADLLSNVHNITPQQLKSLKICPFGILNMTSEHKTVPPVRLATVSCFEPFCSPSVEILGQSHPLPRGRGRGLVTSE